MGKPFRHRDKWRIKWTDEGGRRRSKVFDKFDDARFKLAQYEAEVQEIKRGLRGLRVTEKTFNELCDYWIEKRVPHKRSGKNDISVIRAHLRPHFGPLKLQQITEAHTDEYIELRPHLDKKTIANHLTLLIAMLNAAVRRRWLKVCPQIRKPKTTRINENFRYLKTHGEIQRFLGEARSRGEHVFAMYATAIYTGLRAGELAGLQRDDIDFEKRLITVQRSYDDPTKNEKTRHVPIVDALLPVLRRWMARCPGQVVFPNEAGNMYGRSSRIFQEVLQAVLKDAGFPKKTIKGKQRGYIVFHDLRHYADLRIMPRRALRLCVAGEDMETHAA